MPTTQQVQAIKRTKLNTKAQDKHHDAHNPLYKLINYADYFVCINTFVNLTH